MKDAGYRFNQFLLCGLAWAMLAQPHSAFAGGVDGGGGGGAIRCQAPNGDQPTVVRRLRNGEPVLEVVRGRDAFRAKLTNGRDTQLTDLWEAAVGFGPFFLHPQKVVYREDAIDSQIDRAMQRLAAVAPDFAEKAARALAHVRKHVMNIPEGTYVMPPTDTRIRFLPIGCQQIGFGAYDDKLDNLVIDPTVAKASTKTDFAGLIVHEAVYKALRETENAQDSWKARRIVGLIFAEGPFTLDELEKGFPTE
jgi:hypothetical protein